MSDAKTKIFIASIPFEASDDDLKTFIEGLGFAPKKIFITTERETGRSRGFGFAEFESEAIAEAAIATIGGAQMGGRTLGAAWANQQGPRGRR